MNERAPAYLKSIAPLLTELSTSATGLFMDELQSSSRDPEVVQFAIPQPCLCLFATTVPDPRGGDEQR